MCLQDYQLARAANAIRHDLSLLIGDQLVLRSNSARVGLLLLGPNGGNLIWKVGGSGNQNIVSQVTTTSDIPERYLTILNHGLCITGDIWINASVNALAVLWEYELPVDPVSLKRLAETGKW